MIAGGNVRYRKEKVGEQLECSCVSTAAGTPMTDCCCLARIQLVAVVGVAAARRFAS